MFQVCFYKTGYNRVQIECYVPVQGVATHNSSWGFWRRRTAECTQIDQWCGKLSVLKLYESPADASKLLAIDTHKGLLLNKMVRGMIPPVG